MSKPRATSIVETRIGPSDGAVVLRINRPQKRNAIAHADMVYLAARLAEHQHDASVRAIVITGTGDAFTSGQDVNDINALPGAPLAALFELDIDILTRIVMMPKIVIAAVNGVSAGFGNHLAVCSDICLVKQSAKFHFTGVSKSIPSPMLGTLLLPLAIGTKRAKSLYLRGGVYLPEAALHDGFCNEVVEDSEWDAQVERVAAEFCTRDPQVLALNKYLLNQAVMDRLGAVKLSGIAGANMLGDKTALPTGRAKSS